MIWSRYVTEQRLNVESECVARNTTAASTTRATTTTAHAVDLVTLDTGVETDF